MSRSALVSTFFTLTPDCTNTLSKGGSRHKNWCMERVLSFLIRYFSNYFTFHRSDLAARAPPLDPRLLSYISTLFSQLLANILQEDIPLKVKLTTPSWEFLLGKLKLLVFRIVSWFELWLKLVISILNEVRIKPVYFF